MKHLVKSTIILLIAFTLPLVSQQERRQQKDSTDARPESFGLGLSIGMHTFQGDVQSGSTGFPGTKNSWLIGGNIFATWRLGHIGNNFSTLHLLLRVGYHPLDGKYTGTSQSYEFKDNTIQGSAALQLQLFPKWDFRPYVYAGFGVLSYKPKFTVSKVYLTNPNFKNESGMTGSIPLGGGFTWTVSDAFDIFGNFEKTMTLSDKLDGWVSNINDNFAHISLGIMFYFGREEKKVEPRPVVDIDTDGDGLLDKDEINIYHTDPLKKDTDGDGLNDGEEVLTYKTDPLNKDTDGDGLPDGEEVLKYKTDPLKKDTDGDGLNDGDEVLKYKTNPLNKDTDGDGLTDGDEVLKYKTNPLDPDTDHGSVNDGIEVARGTDPLNPKDDKPQLKVEVGKKIVLEGVVFKTGSAEILPASEEILSKAYNTLKENPEIVVEIQGHTDNVGKHAANMKLSKARAESVKNWLAAKGINAGRISTKGFGPDQPVAPNNTPENKQKNRRIEFFRTK